MLPFSALTDIAKISSEMGASDDSEQAAKRVFGKVTSIASMAKKSIMEYPAVVSYALADQRDNVFKIIKTLELYYAQFTLMSAGLNPTVEGNNTVTSHLGRFSGENFLFKTDLDLKTFATENLYGKILKDGYTSVEELKNTLIIPIEVTGGEEPSGKHRFRVIPNKVNDIKAMEALWNEIISSDRVYHEVISAIKSVEDVSDDDYEAAINHILSQNAEIETLRNRLNSSVSQSQYDRVRDERNDALYKLDEQRQTINRLNDEVSYKQVEIESQRRQYADNIQELRNRNDQLQREIRNAHDSETKARARAELKENEARIQHLRNEELKIKNDRSIRNYQDKLKELEKKNQELIDELNKEPEDNYGGNYDPFDPDIDNMYKRKHKDAFGGITNENSYKANDHSKMMQEQFKKNLSDAHPTMVTIQLFVGEQQKIINLTLGIKCMPHFVGKEEITNLFDAVFENKRKHFRWMQLTSGEISFFRDFVLNMDRIKKDKKLYASLGRHPWYRRLLDKKNKSIMESIARLIPVVTNFVKDRRTLPTCSIILEATEMAYSKFSFSYLQRNKKHIDKIMDELMLLSLVIYDTSADLVYFYFNGFSNPFTYRTRDLTGGGSGSNGGDNTKDLIQIMNKMMNLY